MTDAMQDTGTLLNAGSGGEESGWGGHLVPESSGAGASGAGISGTGTSGAEQAGGTLLGGYGEASEGASGEGSGEAPDPGAYRLELAQQYEADRDNVDAFAAHCRNLGMSREQAQASLDFSVRLHEEQRAAFARQRRDWRSEIQADPDFGGRHFSASCVAAKRALAAFDDSGEVRRMLEETGYGDNPAIIRVFARIGRAMAEDRFIPGRAGNEELPLEQRLYR